MPTLLLSNPYLKSNYLLDMNILNSSFIHRTQFLPAALASYIRSSPFVSMHRPYLRGSNRQLRNWQSPCPRPEYPFGLNFPSVLPPKLQLIYCCFRQQHYNSSPPQRAKVSIFRILFLINSAMFLRTKSPHYGQSGH
jgi:hypothetical protein